MSDLKLGLQTGYWGAGPDPRMVDNRRQNAWAMTPFLRRAWGSDVFTPLTWIGAHTKTIRLGTSIAQLSAELRPRQLWRLT